MKAPGVIYRLGRKPDPWAPPDWASAGPGSREEIVFSCDREEGRRFN